MKKLVYTALFMFCGMGGCAHGTKDAEVEILGLRGTFRVVGGVDFNPRACRTFERIVGAPTLCADIKRLSPYELRQLCPESPDVVVGSAPCKGASALLSAEKSRTPKYQAMNRLSLDWIELMLKTWDVPPRFVLIENVPRLKQRAPTMLKQIRALLRAAGYVFHDGHHECGELGGLAQIRRRYLLVARDPFRCPPLLYQPPKKRVRGCGEVLNELPLPLPGSTDGGPMHRLPNLSWLNWVRLALIPAGGDWRDLEGVLREGQPRREVFRRHHVQDWEKPSDTVAGSGSNGPSAVADPRFGHCDRVRRWDEPAGTVTRSPAPSSGANAVADPRTERFGNSLRVDGWDDPTGTVTAGTHPSNGGKSVADPRVGANLGEHWNKMRVEDWDKPSHTVTGSDRVGSGAPSVADPRLNLGENAHHNLYRVNEWDNPTGTVTGATRPGQGSPSIADPRVSSLVQGSSVEDNRSSPTPCAEQKGAATPDSPTGTVVGNVAKPQCATDSGSAAHALDQGSSLVPKNAFDHGYGVLKITEPSPTVAAGSQVGQGAYAVADPRFGVDAGRFRGSLGVLDWSNPSGTVTGNGRATTGEFSVADPRVESAYHGAYGVLDWHEPSGTVTGEAAPSCGRFGVSDPRLNCEPHAGSYGVMSWEEAAATITGSARHDNGRFAVADPRKPPPWVPIIIAADGTWHRPVTTLELAVLQSFPPKINGEWLVLDGTSHSAWREMIGNAIPPATAKAIMERILVALLEAEAGVMMLHSADTPVWVRREAELS